MSTSLIHITESNDYSREAIRIYQSIGEVAAGEIPAAQKKHVFAVVIRLGKQIDGAWLREYPSLRFIITPTTALTHIDTMLCKMLNITVLSLADIREALTPITATSELTFGLILSLARHIPAACKHVEEKGWDRDKYRGTQLVGKTLGIVGLGRLGSQVARYGEAFGLKIKACDSNSNNKNFRKLNLKSFTFDDVIRSSDIVSLHINETESNKMLFSKIVLSSMKPGALLVNTSRGSIVDEHSILAHLKSGHLGGYATDVINDEYNISRSSLILAVSKFDNLIITPHIGGCTLESMNQTELLMAEKFLKIFSNRKGVVDEQDLLSN